MEGNKFGSNKLKALTNRKVLLGVTSLALCAALIAICSFVPFIIDPSGWQTTEFLTDELIISAIVIVSMVSCIFIGQASNAQNEGSNIAKSRVKFFTSIKQVTNISGFSQWVKKVLQPRDVRSIKERLMRQHGIEDYSVIDLDYPQIALLEHRAQVFGDRCYKGLSHDQVKFLLKLKKGKGYRINLVEPDYYLSVKNLIDNRTITERSSNESLKKTLYLARSIVSKLIITIVVAMIFASLMRDLTVEQDAAKSWMKFLSRVWSMASSAFVGYIVGCQINDIDAEYIEMRVNVHDMYAQDKTFKPLSEEELAKQEYEQQKSEVLDPCPKTVSDELPSVIELPHIEKE